MARTLTVASRNTMVALMLIRQTKLVATTGMFESQETFLTKTFLTKIFDVG